MAKKLYKVTVEYEVLAKGSNSANTLVHNIQRHATSHVQDHEPKQDKAWVSYQIAETQRA